MGTNEPMEGEQPSVERQGTFRKLSRAFSSLGFGKKELPKEEDDGDTPRKRPSSPTSGRVSPTSSVTSKGAVSHRSSTGDARMASIAAKGSSFFEDTNANQSDLFNDIRFEINEFKAELDVKKKSNLFGRKQRTTEEEVEVMHHRLVSLEEDMKLRLAQKEREMKEKLQELENEMAEVREAASKTTMEKEAVNQKLQEMDASTADLLNEKDAQVNRLAEKLAAEELSSTEMFERLRSTEKDLKGETRKNEGHQRRVELLERELKDKTESVHVMSQNLAAANMKIRSVLGDMSELDERLKTSEELIKTKGSYRLPDCTILHHALNNKVINLEERVLARDEEIERLNTLLLNQSERLSEYESDINKMHGEIQLMNDMVEDYKLKAKNALDRVEETERALTVRDSKIEDMIDAMQLVEKKSRWKDQQVGTFEERAKKLQEERDSLEDKVFRLEREIDINRDKIADYQRQHEKLERTEQELQTTTQQLFDLRERNKIKDTELTGRDDLIDSIMGKFKITAEEMKTKESILVFMEEKLEAQKKDLVEKDDQILALSEALAATESTLLSVKGYVSSLQQNISDETKWNLHNKQKESGLSSPRTIAGSAGRSASRSPERSPRVSPGRIRAGDAYQQQPASPRSPHSPRSILSTSTGHRTSSPNRVRISAAPSPLDVPSTSSTAARAPPPNEKDRVPGPPRRFTNKG